VNDPFLVRFLECLGDLPRDRQRFVLRQRTVLQAVGERGPFDQLHDERAHAARFLQAEDRRDVRVMQLRQHLGFALEASEPLGVLRERLGENLDRDLAPQLRIGRAIDLAHPPFAEVAADLIRPKPRSERQAHGLLPAVMRPANPRSRKMVCWPVCPSGVRNVKTRWPSGDGPNVLMIPAFAARSNRRSGRPDENPCFVSIFATSTTPSAR
jgi:hypothetical protein